MDRIYQVFDQVEAEAGAVDLAVVLVVDPVELVEDLVEVLLWNTQAFVLDSDQQVLVLQHGVQGDRSAVG